MSFSSKNTRKRGGRFRPSHARAGSKRGAKERACGFIKTGRDVIVCLTDSSTESAGALGEKLNRGGRGVVRSRAAAGVVLLVLVAHAFVANATHFHTPLAADDRSAQAAVQSRDARGQNAPPSGDANCFLCRLQRDFVSGVQQSASTLAPPPAVSVEHESARETPRRTARPLMRPGRAPPLA